MSNSSLQTLCSNLTLLVALVSTKPTGVYLSRTGEPTKGVKFDAAEAINGNEGSAKVARIPKGSTIRTGTDSKGKRTPLNRYQLAELDSPGAQKPFMGQVQGEKPQV